MSVSVGNNKTYQLRQLRDDAQPRRGELRAPTRRGREFGDILHHPKAGEVVGQFPAKFDKAPARQRLGKAPLQLARERQKPRSAVAALMAREGVSTSTKFSRRSVKLTSAGFGGRAARAQGDDEARTETQQLDKSGEANRNELPAQPVWMSLLGEKAKHHDKPKDAIEAREQALQDKQQEIKAAEKFMGTIGGYSELEKSMKQNDQRILAQAGKIDGGIRENKGPKSQQTRMMELVKNEAVMTQQLNMRYLAIQDKLEKGADELLSNLMAKRDEAVKAAINGEA